MFDLSSSSLAFLVPSLLSLLWSFPTTLLHSIPLRDNMSRREREETQSVQSCLLLVFLEDKKRKTQGRQIEKKSWMHFCFAPASSSLTTPLFCSFIHFTPTSFFLVSSWAHRPSKCFLPVLHVFHFSFLFRLLPDLLDIGSYSSSSSKASKGKTLSLLCLMFCLQEVWFFVFEMNKTG